MSITSTKDARIPGAIAIAMEYTETIFNLAWKERKTSNIKVARP